MFPLETFLTFGTRGNPHITMLYIQPQQAATKELMYTELWTLFYWAATLCYRVKYNPNKTLPVSMPCKIEAPIHADLARYASSRYAIGAPVS